MEQMPKVEISPDFTIEDIHKIREAKAAFVETLTPEEQKEFYRQEGIRAKAVHEKIQQMRKEYLAEKAKHTA